MKQNKWLGEQRRKFNALVSRLKLRQLNTTVSKITGHKKGCRCDKCFMQRYERGVVLPFQFPKRTTDG